MKKFITSFVFFIFSFGIFIPSFASDSTTNYSKQAIIHQTELNKTTK
jgi:hypothetical protein